MPDPAMAVDCTVIPYNSAGAGQDVTFFDADAGTCRTQDSGGSAPTNGFRWNTDDDDVFGSSSFYGTFDDWANCSVTISPGTFTLGNALTVCDAGNSRVNFTANGTYDLEWTLTESPAQGGEVYTLKINITATDDVGHTINSMSITGGAFGTPNTAPVIDAGAIASNTVDENQSSAFDVSTTDDNDTEGAGLTYTLTGGADQANFDLDANTGVLTFKTASDFENPTDAGANNVYNVQVTVTDSGGLTDVIDLAITVGDVDENNNITTVSSVDSTRPTVTILDAQAVLPARPLLISGLSFLKM